MNGKRRQRARRAALVVLVVLGVAAVAFASTRPGGHTPRTLAPGSTLLHAFSDPDGDGILTLGAGDPLIDRTELAPASTVRRVIATFAQISDLHVTDEESPLRVEPIDRLGGDVSSAFRPQESLSTQVLAATEVSVNALRPSLVLITGDMSDNAQHNELAWVLRTLHGGRVDPDSGAVGYDGAQSATSADPFLYRPDIDAPRHPGLMDEAQRPFLAPGLRAPWIPVVSNHDLLVQGVVPTTPQLDRIAVAGRRLVALAHGVLAEIAGGKLGPENYASLLDGNLAGRYVPIAPDPARLPYTPAEALHAIARAARLRLIDGRLVWVRMIAPRLVAIGLDTAIRTGGASGALPPSELAWLGHALTAHRGDRILIVSPTPLEDTEGGGAALTLLDHTPGVVAVLAGDTHRSLVTAHRSPLGGYWLVRAPSLADYPEQARAYRLVELADGRVALETWMLDQAGRDGASGYLGLAGISRDLAFLDPQGGRPKGDAGTRLDRNVRLFLP